MPAVLAVPGLQIAVDHVMFGDVRVAVGDELVIDGTTGRIARPPTEGELPSVHGDDEITPSLEAAYAVETPDENRRLYAEWASAMRRRSLPRRRIDTTCTSPTPSSRLCALRVRRSTSGAERGGRVALHERGVSEIDGVDISPEMLEQAARRCLPATDRGDLTIGMDVADDTYAAVASAGTFTHGHLPPEPIRELIRVTMPEAAVRSV